MATKELTLEAALNRLLKRDVAHEAFEGNLKLSVVGSRVNLSFINRRVSTGFISEDADITVEVEYERTTTLAEVINHLIEELSEDDLSEALEDGDVLYIIIDDGEAHFYYADEDEDFEDEDEDDDDGDDFYDDEDDDY